MYLSLPLPIATERTIPVFYFPYGKFIYHVSSSYSQTEGIPRKLNVKIAKKSKILQFKQTLASHVSTAPERLVLAEIYFHKIVNVYGDDRLVSSIKEGDEIRV